MLVFQMIGREETEIVGNWMKSGDGVVANDACERVHRLTAEYVGSTDLGAWETLFRDPNDERYWEPRYPKVICMAGVRRH